MALAPISLIFRRTSNGRSIVFRRAKSTSLHLSRDKKRKLISLYHQAESFIKPEQLEQHINEEFVRSKSNTSLASWSFSSGKSLEALADRRRDEPKMSGGRVLESEQIYYGSDPRFFGMNTTWSQLQREQNDKVKAALYGNDIHKTGKVGLEKVEQYQKDNAGTRR